MGTLLLVAGGAVAVGDLVPGMIAAASVAFGLASAGLVAFAVDRLKVLAVFERVYRAGFHEPSADNPEAPTTPTSPLPTPSRRRRPPAHDRPDGNAGNGSKPGGRGERRRPRRGRGR